LDKYIKGEKMDEETYIEKKIKCPSCKNNIEFAIGLKNIEIINMKISVKCSSCGTEIILNPSNIIGKIEEEKKEILNEIDVETSSDYEEIEIPSDINDFFEDVEEHETSQEKNEVEENRKTREYINDIFS
jgi:heterodisulfide reductase subunit B